METGNAEVHQLLNLLAAILKRLLYEENREKSPAARRATRHDRATGL